MNLRLLFLRLGLPGFIKKQKLKELFGITAQAFGCDPPDLTGLSGSGLLERYARFTKEQAQKALIGGADVSAIRDRLFKPFQTTKKSGTGLGLTIVNTIVADHNGYIRVRDNIPRGTRFIIEIPLKQENIHQTEA